MKIITIAALVFFSAVTAFADSESFKCGSQPKQVVFSPDGKVIAIPLLDDDGFDVFSVDEKKVTERVKPAKSSSKGFAECIFIPEKNAFFVSQMTTGSIYEFSYPGFEFKRTIKTGGKWSKVIAWNPEKEVLAVSNWVSNDVSIIGYKDGKVLRKIKTAAAPRGLLFTDSGKSLIVLTFDGGKIQKFNVDDGKKLKENAVDKSAMRHIVRGGGGKAFVTDMFHATVYEIDTETLKITRKVKVQKNPNTLAIFGKRLFVSCRGRNNPTDYTKRSPENGFIIEIDTETMQIVRSIQGGNQPTGLDVSGDGKTLCFSNFQDAEIVLMPVDDELKIEN